MALLPRGTAWALFLILFLFIFIDGVIDGILFNFYVHTRMNSYALAWLEEVEFRAQLSYYSPPGLPALLNPDIGPFYGAPQLWTRDWVSKLRLFHPYQSGEGRVQSKADLGLLLWSPVRDLEFDNKMGGISMAEIKARPGWDGSNFHQFIYITRSHFDHLDDWDRAFDELQRWHYRHPPLKNASFFTVDCDDSPFLCTSWNVRTPALLHLSVDLQAQMGRDATKPVVPRMIEFPLQGWVPPRGQFPSPFEQLKTVTSGEYDILNIPTFTMSKQFTRGVREDLLDWKEAHSGGFSGWVHNVSMWVVEPQPPVARSVLLFVHQMGVSLVWNLAKFSKAYAAVGSFLGWPIHIVDSQEILMRESEITTCWSRVGLDQGKVQEQVSDARTIYGRNRALAYIERIKNAVESPNE
ncbi:hypothetical protein BX600DRAFT_477288 [Xylariales sp. PMI_506]|nr:hypothetical protein BX600DRAFT_477288 [Xylariales sp. PMI_506]